MTTVQTISINAIDSKSTINVRRQGVDENVEKVKTSIQAHGYWPDMPIVIRPHPDVESPYDYEHVTGQCRLKACLELGMEEIPAFVFELSDDEAIQRSWLENEARGDLTYSDRAYWTERIYKKYAGDRHTGQEALEKAADYLGVGVQTVMRYYTLVALPEDLKQMVDQESYQTHMQFQLYGTRTMEHVLNNLRRRCGSELLGFSVLTEIPGNMLLEHYKPWDIMPQSQTCPSM